MSDNDLIRRGDALYAIAGWEIPSTAIAALPAVTVGVKPLDLSCVQKHAFLSGVVAARNVPPGDPCSGPLLWLDYDPGDHPALARILAALDLTPAPDAAAIREAALREARQRVNDLVAERQADLHGARNDFNRGAVDALQEACSVILALLPKGGA